jgi:glycosyltransferase 2 family protein
MKGTRKENCMKRALIYFGFALSAILLWLVLRNIDGARMLQAVLAINSGYFALSLIFYLLTIFFRSVRWRYLLESERPIAVSPLLSATSIGLMTNNVLPLRIGDVARAYLIGRHARISGVTAFATLAVERIVDALCLLSILGFYLRVMRGQQQIQQVGLRMVFLGAAFVMVLACAIGVIYLASKHHLWVENVITRVLGTRFPGASKQVLSLFAKASAGFAALHDWSQLVRVFLFSLCLWLSGAVSYYYLMRSFSFPLGFSSALLVLVFVTFGVAFPSAPGFAGTFHAFCILGLSAVGMHDPSLAATYAFTLHGTEWLASTALGLFFLWREGLSFKELRQRDFAVVPASSS